ncbi:hypothetical protein [Pseudomonas viridiflava]|uniref:hypothetical protein n=1 Tax=Pseudomonas viridiflava TaxID=33069 RepID=UPI001F142723|nr:hypothetical protein [Pseudomonas viridiflava]
MRSFLARTFFIKEEHSSENQGGYRYVPIGKFKHGAWQAVGYWRIALDVTHPPKPPVPFSEINTQIQAPKDHEKAADLGLWLHVGVLLRPVNVGRRL